MNDFSEKGADLHKAVWGEGPKIYTLNEGGYSICCGGALWSFRGGGGFKNIQTRYVLFGRSLEAILLSDRLTNIPTIYR